MNNPQPTTEKKSNKALIIIIVAIVVIGAGVGVYFASQGKNTNTKQTTNATTNADAYAILKKYDGKVVKISSADGKVSGQMAIAFRMSEQMPIQVVYFLKVKDALPKKATVFSGESYFYIANHAKAADIRIGKGTGTLSPAFCNQDQTPDVLTMAKTGNMNVATYSGCAAQNDVNASTDTFYHVYADYYNNYTFDYNLLVGKDTFAVFDTSSYYTGTAETGYQVDSGKAIAGGNITAQYALTYSE